MDALWWGYVLAVAVAALALAAVFARRAIRRIRNRPRFQPGTPTAAARPIEDKAA